VKRIRAGLELQRSRILDRAATAPRVLEDSPYEVINLTDTPDNDLDYYAYELGRLQDAAREMAKVFTNPKEVTEALDAFNAALPNLRAARNPLTHPRDNARLDNVAWFSALVRPETASTRLS
jgi:hypothetical protein